MNKKELFPSLIAITFGIALIIVPFFTEIKKSLILLGIVPLWIGCYFIYHLFSNSSDMEQNDEASA